MPRVRHGGREELVGLHVFGDGKAAEEVLGQVLGVQRMPLKKRTREFAFLLFCRLLCSFAFFP